MFRIKSHYLFENVIYNQFSLIFAKSTVNMYNTPQNLSFKNVLSSFKINLDVSKRKCLFNDKYFDCAHVTYLKLGSTTTPVLHSPETQSARIKSLKIHVCVISIFKIISTVVDKNCLLK